MSVFRCKMCGGTIEFEEGASVGICDSCGTKQTLPRLDSDKKANLYDRANHFRRNNEYDKAISIYDQILNEDNTDAEAYWSLVLCRYGIEYVEDPATHKRVPTVNRAQFTSVFDDDNYKSALRYADGYQKSVYEEEANTINEIQKGILAVSQKEEPFDVFICYKETDESGRRTQDSVIANDLYHQLTQEGFKVFFSRITLEDKIGTAYEPYIFAALNSAKVMVVLGTKPEYFNAVWVKNEWSRFLALVKESNGKKMLVPAYRDMDPYNLPEEFSHLQAQDMSKLGFMQDLIRGIKKITGADEVKQPEKVVVERGNTNIDALIERAFMSLEFNEWDKADDFCEQVLNQDPKNPQAYLGKLLAELKLASKNELINCAEPFDDSKNYIQAVRFSDSLEKELKSFNEQIRNRNEEARKEGIYSNAKSLMDKAASEFDYNKVSQTFSQIPGYKDADSLVNICKERIVEIQKKEEEKIREIEEKEELQRAAAKKKKILISAICLMLALATVISVVMVTVIIPQNKIKKATESFNQGNYSDIYAGYKFNFGTYNGEDITWRVLAKEENKILVISDKALFHKEYNEVYTDTTWEKCTLRKYLNNDFLNNCFSEENQKKILKTKVINDNNPEYGTSGGADTMDKVFLLSIDEANKYFASDNDRKARDILGQKSFWWLRSPGYSSNFAACVCGDGSVDNFGFNVIRGGLAVRPALWINLES